MILPKTTTPPFEADFTELFGIERFNDLPESDQKLVKGIRYNTDTDDYEVIFTEKHERNSEKEEIKRLKAENKALRDRIAEATDFPDLKTKITKIKDSETTPTKWTDKVDYLEGEHIEHKGIIYLSLEDHTADKASEPANTPELYQLA